MAIAFSIAATPPDHEAIVNESSAMNIFAYTASDKLYPGYVSINREPNGDLTVTVREAPTIKAGVRVCGRDCIPLGPFCNNYCNHDKSRPIADRPEETEHVIDGTTASFSIPAVDWPGMVGRL